MTAFERVRSTKRSLSIVLGSAAVFWAGAALFGLLALVAVLGATVALPSVLRGILPIIAILGAIGTLGYFGWRSRFAWSFDSVALWIEEKAPQLRYALVTAIDPRYKDSASIMEPLVAKVDTAPFVREAAKRSTLPALAAFLVAVGIFFAIPSEWKEKLGIDIDMPGRNTAGAVMGNRLVPLYATLTPPAYSRIPVRQLEEPTTVSGLQGSVLVLTGKGSPDGIEILQETPEVSVVPVPVTAGGQGWMATIRFTDSVPSLLKFKDRQYTRTSVIIDPIIDQPPAAKLLLPVRDTTLRMKDGKVPGVLMLSTDLRDDIGLSRAVYEVTIAAGGGGGDGSFEFRDTIIGVRNFNGEKAAKLEHSIPYAAFGLGEGHQLFVRAVVYDNNGYAVKPGKGYSETRTIRIATSSEYDTLNVNPAPPSADTALMTLRMLIIATEKLDSNKTKMERKPFVDSAYKLGGASEKVRQTINRIIDEQTGGGEIDADPRLRLAADSMWSASRSLFIAETREALPAMYAAYKAILDYTNTARYYLRGILKPEPVNIDRVRLTGKDTANVTQRKPRGVSEVDKVRMQQQYSSAIRQIPSDPAAAMEKLISLQVESLRKYPELAKALGGAVEAIRSKKDASQFLLQARQFLEGNAGILTTMPAWSGAW